MPPELFNELENLLKEYESIFRKSKADLGKCTVMEHKIDLSSALERRPASDDAAQNGKS